MPKRLLIVLTFALLAGGVVQAGWLLEERLTERPDLSDKTTLNNARAIASDPDGDLHVVWYGKTDDRYQVWYSRCDARTRTWSEDTVISDEDSGACYPAVATDDSGNVHVVWQVGPERYGFALRYRRRDVLTGEWGPFETVVDSGIHVERPSIAARSPDSVVAGWDQQFPSQFENVLMSVRTTLGWSEPEAVSEIASSRNAMASVGIDSMGRIEDLWRCSAAEPQILFRWRSDTVWSRIDTLQSGYQCAAPSLWVESDGTLHAVWMGDILGGSGEYLIYRQRRGGAWRDTVVLPRVSRHPQPASICADEFGRIHAVWCADMTILGLEVFYSTAEDSGKSWAVPFRLTNASQRRENPTLCCGPGTNIQLVWTDYRHAIGPRPDVYCCRYEVLHDVGVLRIERPQGMVDSGAVVTPSAWIGNYGDSTETGVRVWFRIDTVRSERVIAEILPGDSLPVEFDSLLAKERGWRMMSCSTALEGDINPDNNAVFDSFFVCVRDVAVESIIAPRGVQPRGTIQPRVLVHNQGNVSADFICRFRIEDSAGVAYAESVPTSLGAGLIHELAFPYWVGQTGFYCARCSVDYVGDMHPENDTASTPFELYWRDVGITGILWPPAVVDSGITGWPTVRVCNYGSRSEGFCAFLGIEPDYYDSLVVENLTPGRDTTLRFANWEPFVRGQHPLVCSLCCSGDMNLENNVVAGSLFIQVRDVAVESIIEPVGALPLDTVWPKAYVHNRGNVPAQCTCRFWIAGSLGVVYADTIAPELEPESGQMLEFDPWLGEPGEYLAHCSTSCEGDMHLENDTTSTPFELYWRDVGIVEVVWPPAVVDSGMTGWPTVRVCNYGSRNEGFGAFLGIEPDYYDSLVVESLMPGHDTTVRFTDWHPLIRGRQPLECSLSCPGDMNLENNLAARSVFVRVQDVCVAGIVSPVEIVREDTVVPKARVGNQGNVTANLSCLFTITDDSLCYSDSLQLELAPGSVTLAVFRPWPTHIGGFTARCTVCYEPDVHPENDTASRAFQVVRSDVGVIEIVWPGATVDSGAAGSPRARVKNFGSQSEDFPVLFRIGSQYADTVNVVGLAPEEEREVAFADWQALIRGTCPLCCSAMLDGDKIDINNASAGSVFVRVTDVGVAEILRPVGTIGLGEIEPLVLVTNYGNERAVAGCYFEIRSGASLVYEDSVSLELEPESSSTVEFRSWQASCGSYRAECWTVLAGDMCSANDTASAEFRVIRIDAAAQEILSPIGVIEQGVVEPRVLVANLGEEAADIIVSLAISDSGLVYADTVLVSGVLPSAETIAVFREWDAAAGYYMTLGCVTLAGDNNPVNDTVSGTVMVESLVSRRWTELASVPLGARRAPVRDGGSLVAVDDGILALKGCNTNEWYRYDAGEDSWISLAPMPLGSEAHKVKAGAALCWDGGNTVFALKGNRTHEFWGYDIAEDSWFSLPSLPAGTRPVRYGAGLVFVPGDTDRVFLIKGSRTLDFLVYWIGPSQWHARRSLPAGARGRKAGQGTCLTSLGGRIFCLKGKTNEFYEYFPAGDSWTAMASVPRHNRRDRARRCRRGAALAGDGSRCIHAFRGGGCNEFWVYDAIADTWCQSEDIPRGSRRRKVKRGGGLAWFAGRVYALKGGGCREFWCYDPEVVLAARPARAAQDRETSSSVSGAVRLQAGPGSGGVLLVKGLPELWGQVHVFDALGRQVRVLALRDGDKLVLTGFERSGIYFLAVPGRPALKLTVTR